MTLPPANDPTLPSVLPPATSGAKLMATSRVRQLHISVQVVEVVTMPLEGGGTEVRYLATEEKTDRICTLKPGTAGEVARLLTVSLAGARSAVESVLSSLIAGK